MAGGKALLITTCVSIPIVLIISVVVALTVYASGKAKTTTKSLRAKDMGFEDWDPKSLQPTSKYAFVYVGLPRTWERAVPMWHGVFEKLKPDVYIVVNTQERFDKKKLLEAFGPHVKIKALHYWSMDEETKQQVMLKAKRTMQFGSQYFTKYPKMKIELNEENATRFTYQFAQIQWAFRNWDFSKYEKVIKMRLDVKLAPGKGLEINGNSVEKVFPAVAKLWKEHPNYKDFVLPEGKEQGRVQSFIEFGDPMTLGGAYMINDDLNSGMLKTNRDATKNMGPKSVWMCNDFVYWSSASNMIDINKDIFDQYCDHFIDDLPMSFSPESHLYLHAHSKGYLSFMDLQSIFIEHYK